MKNKFPDRYFLMLVLSLTVTVFQHCSTTQSIKQPAGKNEFTESPSGLQYKIIREGTGKPVIAGQEILLHETLWYRNDSLLFDSRKLPSPIKVRVGASQVIKGIDEGLPGMKKGEIKKLIVPPALSKRTGVHSFPHPDSILVYEIELIDILKK